MNLFIREIKAMLASPWQLALVTYLPLIGGLLLWGIFSSAVPRSLPVAIIDMDNSSLSRLLIRDLQANPTIAPIIYQQLPKAKLAMQEGKVFALVVLPYQLRKNLLSARQPSIEIRYNSQFLLVGKLLSSELQISLGSGLSSLASLKQLAQGVPKGRVGINLSPISLQKTALFNQNSNYVAFLVPALIIALLQIIGMLVFLNSLTQESENRSAKSAESLGIWKVLACKFSLYSIIILIHAMFAFTFFYLYLALPIHGSLWMLGVAFWIMLIADFLIVLLIYSIFLDSTRVVSICTALFAPAMTFMGVTFPTHNMPVLAQYWRQLIPSTQYIETHISIISHGLSQGEFIFKLSHNWGFAMLIIPIIYFVNKGKNHDL
ncbi:ABC-2 type transporter [Psychromonas sp. CNPT3]|uniref:ABC transporter permease n=1 Tax=Psychromonas sp. CNPT3 TaxID=314282 RepID=UPI00006E78CD|nr:ABC transporter permease [Psychromonas sp. CNPT3]AGH82089.1 ABC-2 type transporter [Psychromonas sp. CNPT3]